MSCSSCQYYTPYIHKFPLCEARSITGSGDARRNRGSAVTPGHPAPGVHGKVEKSQRGLVNSVLVVLHRDSILLRLTRSV